VRINASEDQDKAKSGVTSSSSPSRPFSPAEVFPGYSHVLNAISTQRSSGVNQISESVKLAFGPFGADAPLFLRTRREAFVDRAGRDSSDVPLTSDALFEQLKRVLLRPDSELSVWTKQENPAQRERWARKLANIVIEGLRTFPSARQHVWTFTARMNTNNFLKLARPSRTKPQSPAAEAQEMSSAQKKTEEEENLLARQILQFQVASINGHGTQRVVSGTPSLSYVV